MKIYLDLVQQSPEWYAVKDLKLTSSEATAIGNNGKGLDTLCRTLVRKHYSSCKESGFQTKDTQRGNELEPLAREMYELETGKKVQKVGFIEMDEYTGASTDGLIGEEGVWEGKALDDNNHFQIIMDMEVPSDYDWQAQMELLVTGRRYVDLTFYNPNFDKSLVIFTVYPDPHKQEALRKGLETGKRLIREYMAKYEERRLETAPRVVGGPPKNDTVLVYEGSKLTGAFTLPKVVDKPAPLIPRKLIKRKIK